MKKLLLTLLVGIFLFSLVGATSIGTFKQSEDVEIYQTCNNCTYCNFTKVKYPNGTSFLSNLSATKENTYYFYNVHGANHSTIGDYSYCYECGNAAEIETGCLDYTITPSGRGAPSSGEGMTYLASIGSMILITIFFFCLSFAIKPESALRFIFIALSFVMAIITVLYAFVGINETLAGFTNIVDNFGTFYFVLLMVLFVIFILVLLALTFKALEMLKLKKGLKEED